MAKLTSLTEGLTLSTELSRILDHPLNCDIYIEAPAGHGKTTAAMIKAAEVAARLSSPLRQAVLVLTFSKMAVRQIDVERRQRVHRDLQPRIVIKTYHSFYFDLIRQYACYLGFDNNKLDLLTEGVRKILFDSFGINHPTLDFDQFTYSQYLREGLPPPLPVIKNASDELISEAATFLETYHKEENLIGFEDFPYYTYQIVSNSEFVRDLLTYKYPVIILDEFQNTNDLQWMILRAFTTQIRLIVFADPNQTIHSFRGAGKSIHHFKEQRNPEVISLKTNHRNSSSLFDFAHSIASGAFDVTPPPNVSFRRISDPFRDPWNLKFHILNLKKNSDIRSIGILTKENKHVSEVSDLFRKTPKTPYIPHEVVSEDSSIQEQENVILWLFQLISSRDLKYLHRFGSALCACRTSGESNYLHYFQQAIAFGSCDISQITNTEGVAGTRNARIILKELNLIFETPGVNNPQNVWQQTQQVLEGMKAISSLPDLKEIYLHLHSQWALLVAQKEHCSVEDFLYHIMADRRQRNFLEHRTYDKGTFVMTLHQSQGKQFDAVIIWRCNENIIPHTNEIQSGDTTASQYLLYVGITRARKKVFIYYHDNQQEQPSRFIRPFIRSK